MRRSNENLSNGCTGSRLNARIASRRQPYASSFVFVLAAGALLAMPATAQNSQPETQGSASAQSPTAATGDPEKSICLLVESAARSNNLPVNFFVGVIWQESRFRADAVGPVTRRGERALGIAQFMPKTAAGRSLLDPFDPIQALPKSAEYLRELRQEFGNLGLAAAAYNAGPRRVRDWINGSGQMPAETRRYVLAITGRSVEHWSNDPPDANTKGIQELACEERVAMLKRTPNRFVSELAHRVVLGAQQPWGAILAADRSRERIIERYAALQLRHAAVLAGRDPIVLERHRSPLPRFQVRVGLETRSAADQLCARIQERHGDCVVLRNPRG